tara:strand:+ start:732 stop:1394 length:663 start_codon:yes stop_codon:yes gene_type:complete
MVTLLIAAGLKHVQKVREANRKRAEADREHQRAINQHIIEDTAIRNKWRNTAEDKAIIAQRKRIEAQDNIAKIDQELAELEASTVNQIREQDVAYIKGGYSEATGRRSGLKMTNREILLSQTGKRQELALKLTGKRDRAALLTNIQERKQKQAWYDWDRSVNAARPGGRHLPPHPGHVKMPSLLDTGLEIATGMLDQNMQRNKLLRESGEIDPNKNKLPA